MVKNLRSTAGKLVEIVEMCFGGEIIIIIPKCIIIFNRKISRYRNRHSLQKISACCVQMNYSKYWQKFVEKNLSQLSLKKLINWKKCYVI